MGLASEAVIMGRPRKSDQTKEASPKVSTPPLHANALATMSNGRVFALQGHAQDKEKATHKKSKACPEDVFLRP